MKRGQILTDAVKVINGDRQDTYGNPEDSFETISQYWSLFLKKKLKVNIDKQDVAMMLVLFKIAREENQHKKDNLVDAAGYLGILGDMHSVKGASE